MNRKVHTLHRSSVCYIQYSRKGNANFVTKVNEVNNWQTQFMKVPQCSQMFLSVPQCSLVFPSVPQCYSVFPRVREHCRGSYLQMIFQSLSVKFPVFPNSTVGFSAVEHQECDKVCMTFFIRYIVHFYLQHCDGPGLSYINTLR